MTYANMNYFENDQLERPYFVQNINIGVNEKCLQNDRRYN